MPTFHPPIPVLRIFDAQKALEFYVDFLGFTLEWRAGGGDTPLYMQLALGACRLQLSEHFGDGTPGSVVKIRTDDLDAYHQALLAKQYRHARPGIDDQSWGEREMSIADPFSNRLTFWCPLDPV